MKYIVVIQPLGAPDSERRRHPESEPGTMRQALLLARTVDQSVWRATIIEQPAQAPLFGLAR